MCCEGRVGPAFFEVALAVDCPRVGDVGHAVARMEAANPDGDGFGELVAALAPFILAQRLEILGI